jgi:hypothetical protein
MYSQMKVNTYPHILYKMITLFMEEEWYNHAMKVICLYKVDCDNQDPLHI